MKGNNHVKKIVLGTVLILFLGGLAFGAAYRTLAKNSSNSSLSEAESTSGIWQGKGSSSEAEITCGPSLLNCSSRQEKFTSPSISAPKHTRPS